MSWKVGGMTRTKPTATQRVFAGVPSIARIATLLIGYFSGRKYIKQGTRQLTLWPLAETRIVSVISCLLHAEGPQVDRAANVGR
jgi:hypothetical protein